MSSFDCVQVEGNCIVSELNADEQNVNLGFMGFQGESEVGSHERSS